MKQGGEGRKIAFESVLELLEQVPFENVLFVREAKVAWINVERIQQFCYLPLVDRLGSLAVCQPRAGFSSPPASGPSFAASAADDMRSFLSSPNSFWMSASSKTRIEP